MKSIFTPKPQQNINKTHIDNSIHITFGIDTKIPDMTSNEILGLMKKIKELQQIKGEDSGK